MKKLIALALIVAVVLLCGSIFSPSLAQSPASADTPTFYHLVPGTYVNGWPRFTIHYPKDWVELPHLRFNQFFVAGAPGPTTYPHLEIAVAPGLTLDTVKDFMARLLRIIATDVTVISDKPSHLRDGAPAREFEFTYKVNDVPAHWVGLAAMKGDEIILVDMVTRNGMVREDLKAYVYSVELQPELDKPVKVPSDVQAFLDEHSSAMVAHDLAKVMAHYSDKYLNSGVRKGETERFFGQQIGLVTSQDIVVTDFIPAGDRAYLAGCVRAGDRLVYQLIEISIIKENGEWKWYGNQRDAVP